MARPAGSRWISEGIWPRLLFLTAALGAGGCVFLRDEVRYEQMAPRLSYQGFSFERPPNLTWYFRRSEEHYTHVTLRRDLWFSGPTHTFYALVSLGGVEREPTSHEDFAELARLQAQRAPYETRTDSYQQSLVTKQGQWCIRFEASYTVIGAPVSPNDALTMIMRGYRCRHPTWPHTTLDFAYSERGLPEEIDPDLWKEGEHFLDGVRIDAGPNTPAGPALPPQVLRP